MRRALVLSGLFAATLLACNAASSEPAPRRSESEVTSITPTPGVEQTISNCWDFAATGWLESLAMRPAGGAPIDLSEGYVSYLHWLLQITAPDFTALEVTGRWGRAVQLVRVFGWMSEQEFLSLDAPVDYAVRHREALLSIQLELTGGELKTPEQRADRAHVVRVLDRVWQVSPQISAELAQVFGDGFTRGLVNPETDTTGTHLRRLDAITVGYAADGNPITASDLVGTPADAARPFNGQRVGPFAFSEVVPPVDDADVRGYVLRAQKALAQDIPLYMGIMADNAQVDATGTYQKPANGVLAQAAGHAVTVFDLAVQTRDFGLLPAGVPETRPEARAASLRDDSMPTIFRARNSFWGSYNPGPASLPVVPGSPATNDFTLDYLFMPLPTGGRVLTRLLLPNDPDVVIGKAPEKR